MGCCLWGCTESDVTEVTWQQQQHPGVGCALNSMDRVLIRRPRGDRCVDRRQTEEPEEDGRRVASNR